MRIRSKLYQCIALIALTGMMNGCGGGGSSSSSYVQTGKLVQGPVTGATIFADRVDAGVGVRFVQDGNEIAATTLADGSYTLPTLPSYSYILVSKGGTDKLTGLNAVQMLAPAGSANITPLTTLVTLDTTNPTLDPTKGVIAKLKALLPAGVGYDTDISENSSPAVLLLVKSIETATKSLTDAITSKTGSTISDQQNAYIQAQIMQSIAQTLVASSLDLRVPANVNTMLKNSIDLAIININTVNAANIHIPNTASATAILIADSSVNAAATTLGVTDQSLQLVTATVRKEATLAEAAKVFNAVAITLTATIGTTITAADTPDTYSPPEITVVTVTISAVITGATGSTGSSGTGTQF